MSLEALRDACIRAIPIFTLLQLSGCSSPGGNFVACAPYIESSDPSASATCVFFFVRNLTGFSLGSTHFWISNLRQEASCIAVDETVLWGRFVHQRSDDYY